MTCTVCGRPVARISSGWAHQYVNGSDWVLYPELHPVEVTA